jgi:CYTH domain-containing protein
MEIERKYLLSALPPRESLGRGVAIRQGYIDAADPEIRVRQKGSEFFLTVKSRGPDSGGDVREAVAAHRGCAGGEDPVHGAAW